MPINVTGATVNSYNRTKLSPGTYTCKVKDLRVKNGFKGEGFWADLVVAEGPDKGIEFSQAYYPDNARASGNMTVEMARNKERGKIIVLIAAALGYASDQAAEVVSQETFEKAIARPVSCYAGKLIKVISVPWTNRSGEQTVYYEFYPLKETELHDRIETPATDSRPAASVQVPLPPAPPAVWEPPAGWAVHPEPKYASEGWYYKGTEVKHRSAFV